MKNIAILLLTWFCSLHAASAPFQIKIKTDNPGASASNQFILPLRPLATYDFTVAWGDGSSQIVTSYGDVTHTYGTPGTYTISISENTPGGFPRIYFNSAYDHLKLLELTAWGDVHWQSFESAFSGCANLVITATDHASANTATVTSFAFAWYDCSSLTSFPLINTAAGQNFNAAWAGCRNLTAFPLINTANGTNFAFAWRGCSSLTTFPLIDTTAGTDFSTAWFECSGLTSFPLINTANGIYFSLAWSNCSSLTSFPLLNTAAGRQFSFAWRDCTGLTSFPLINTANGTDFSAAWNRCSSLTTFPLINTANGTNFSFAWQGCTGLTSFPPINTAKGTNFGAAWNDCSSLTSFPLINTAAGTTFSNAWQGCSGLTSFPLINTAAGTNFISTWRNCSSLTSFPLINTAAGTQFWATWYGCSSLVRFPLINTTNGIKFAYAWSGCSSLIDFPAINTAAGTDFDGAWESCLNLASFPALDLGKMNRGTGCFNQVTLPTATYSALLTDLAARNSNTNVTFDGGLSRYNSSGLTARSTLTGAKGWTIRDSGPAVPLITSPLAASVEQGAPFTYIITASNDPTSFGATGVPSPLTRTTNVISGAAPSVAGTYTITLEATNALGTGTRSLTLYVNAPGAPTITSATTAGGIYGQSITAYQITATNSPTWWAAVNLPNGLTCNPATGAITGTPTEIGTKNVSLRATNAAGTGVAPLTFTVVAPAGASGSSSGGGGGGGGCGAGALSAALLALFVCLGCRRHTSTSVESQHA